jgi:NAD-specific glutamate dehydrogenase
MFDSEGEVFGTEMILQRIEAGKATIDDVKLLAQRHRAIKKKVAGWCELAAKEKARADSLAAEVERLRAAIRLLADQDATLSVCGGSVTVTMDATITDDDGTVDRLAAEVAQLRISRSALTLALQRAIDFVPVPEEAVRAADAQRVICDALRNHGGAA